MPRVANLLRERELHIEKLKSELAQKEQWLAEVTADRDQALAQARDTENALAESNRWAEQISAELTAAGERIVELQAQFVAAQQQAQESLDSLEAENQKKTDWALALGAEVEVLRGQVARVLASRWVRAGHKIGMGPPLPGLDKPAQ